MNKILNNIERENYKETINEIHNLCPETILKKIPEANVQQAFVLKTVKDLTDKSGTILSIGAYDDTASESIKKLGYNIVEIDPDNELFSHPNRSIDIINIDLHNYRLNNETKKFNTIIATSVIEHVENDEEFIDDICNLLELNGIAMLTCDFNNKYTKGANKPSVDYRLYTEYDLIDRFKKILIKNNCEIYGEINYSSEPDFIYCGCLYSFATYVFKKTK